MIVYSFIIIYSFGNIIFYFPDKESKQSTSTALQIAKSL